MDEIQKTIQDIPQPEGAYLAAWYTQTHPTPYELLVRLAQALHGTLKIEDLIDTNGVIMVDDLTKEETTK
jgi:hypothetical protein